MKQVIALIGLMIFSVNGSAVTLLSPTSSANIISGDQFSWQSSNSQYCWENYIQIYDEFEILIYDSGLFNPNGGDSIVNIENIPTDGSYVRVFIQCNPQQQLDQYFATYNDRDSGTSDNGGSDGTNGGTGDTGGTSEISMTYDSGLNEIDLARITEAILLAFAVAFVFRMIRRQMR